MITESAAIHVSTGKNGYYKLLYVVKYIVIQWETKIAMKQEGIQHSISLQGS